MNDTNDDEGVDFEWEEYPTRTENDGKHPFKEDIDSTPRITDLAPKPQDAEGGIGSRDSAEDFEPKNTETHKKTIISSPSSSSSSTITRVVENTAPDPTGKRHLEPRKSEAVTKGSSQEGDNDSSEAASPKVFYLKCFGILYAGLYVLAAMLLTMLIVIFVIISRVGNKSSNQDTEESPESPSPSVWTLPPTRAPIKPASGPPSPSVTSSPSAGPCLCAPCPCVTPFTFRGNSDLPGYGGTSHPTLDLSATGDILVTRQGGNDGDLVQAWRWNGSTEAWEIMGTPFVGIGGASLSHGASVLSLSANGIFLVLGTNRLQFWTYDSAINAWWGPSAGDSVGQPSTTGNPNPDEFYTGSYSVTLSDDGNRLLMVGDAMELQPVAAHVYDRQNMADWVRAGQPLFNEQINYVNFAATMSGDGNTVAVGAPDTIVGRFNRAGRVRVFNWNATTSTWVQLGQSLEVFGALKQFGNQISLSFDGRTLAAQTLTGVQVFQFDNALNDWSANGPEIPCQPNQTFYPSHFSTLSGNGRVVAVAGCIGLGNAVDKDGKYGHTGIVRVFDLDDEDADNPWKRVGESDLYGINQGGSRVESLALSFTGSVLAMGSTAGELYTDESGFETRDPGIVRVFERVL